MKRVAIDIDEVLVSFVKPMAKWRGYDMPTFKKYPYVYRTMFNITETESRNMVREFYESNRFANLEPIKGAQDYVEHVNQYADKLYIMTGRQDYARKQTETWLDKWFPKTFDDLIMTNSYTSIEVEKHDLCRSLALDTIIDDSFETCSKCNRMGMNSINIIGHDGIKYPWAVDSKMARMGWK